MLTNLLVHSLAVGVGLGSLTLYLAAFFFPEVHRRHDFFWSGVGLFYALVLWFTAGSMDATALLGHGASVSLLGWLGWQTLTLRRKRTPLALQTPYTSDSWPNLRRETLALLQDLINQTALGRWLTRSFGNAAPIADQTQGVGLRASSLKQVDYEFLDDLANGAVASEYRSANPALPPMAQTDSSPVARFRESRASVEMEARPRPSSIQLSPQRRSPLNWRQRGQVLGAWIGDLWRSLTAPKPKRAVIEIPPREPILHPPPGRGSDDLGAVDNGILDDQPGEQDPSANYQD
ncbi:MAG: Ycf66 family protein [Cyanobacteriota bacterium]|nr:Ycf66 family protein [Cyanobacteriota bacterium]